MPFQSGIGSGGGGGGSGTVTSVSLRDENSVSTSAITTSGFFQLDAGPGISTAASGYTVTISGDSDEISKLHGDDCRRLYSLRSGYSGGRHHNDTSQRGKLDRGTLDIYRRWRSGHA
jgi:hypothetical protein